MSTSSFDKDQSYFSLSKECNTNKCSPKIKCPCILHINCRKYIDIRKQQLRLKSKSPEEFNNIYEWYKTYFKIDGNFHDLYCSG